MSGHMPVYLCSQVISLGQLGVTLATDEMTFLFCSDSQVCRDFQQLIKLHLNVMLATMWYHDCLCWYMLK